MYLILFGLGFQWLIFPFFWILVKGVFEIFSDVKGRLITRKDGLRRLKSLCNKKQTCYGAKTALPTEFDGEKTDYDKKYVVNGNDTIRQKKTIFVSFSLSTLCFYTIFNLCRLTDYATLCRWCILLVNSPPV